MIFLAVVWGNFLGKSYHDLTGNYMYFESSNLIPLDQNSYRFIRQSQNFIIAFFTVKMSDFQKNLSNVVSILYNLSSSMGPVLMYLAGL